MKGEKAAETSLGGRLELAEQVTGTYYTNMSLYGIFATIMLTTPCGIDTTVPKKEMFCSFPGLEVSENPTLLTCHPVSWP